MAILKIIHWGGRYFYGPYFREIDIERFFNIYGRMSGSEIYTLIPPTDRQFYYSRSIKYNTFKNRMYQTYVVYSISHGYIGPFLSKRDANNFRDSRVYPVTFLTSVP